MADSDAVAAATAALHEVHRRAAESTYANAKEVAEARRRLALALRAEEDHDLPIPARLAPGDLAEIRSAYLALGLPADTRPTDLDTVRVLRTLPDTLAALLVERWRVDAERGWSCYEQNHEPQLERMRDELHAAAIAHGCWTPGHTHPQETDHD